jgi:uncharacterized protein (DUF1015 family)
MRFQGVSDAPMSHAFTGFRSIQRDNWRSNDDALSKLLAKLHAVNMADGYHRGERGARCDNEKKRETGGSLPEDHPAASFLARLFAETELRISDLNRLATGVKGPTELVLQAILGSRF